MPEHRILAIHTAHWIHLVVWITHQTQEHYALEHAQEGTGLLGQGPILATQAAPKRSGCSNGQCVNHRTGRIASSETGWYSNTVRTGCRIWNIDDPSRCSNACYP